MGKSVSRAEFIKRVVDNAQPLEPADKDLIFGLLRKSTAKTKLTQRTPVSGKVRETH
jgi:hypothetical protein